LGLIGMRRWEITITVLLTYLWTVMILLRLFQESKNIIFTCGDSKNHSWPSPLVIFSVPTRENNVFLLSFHRTVILHNHHNLHRAGNLHILDMVQNFPHIVHVCLVLAHRSWEPQEPLVSRVGQVPEPLVALVGRKPREPRWEPRLPWRNYEKISFFEAELWENLVF
jgi:hypothetical protein